MKYPLITIELPLWVEGFMEKRERLFPTVEDRMRLVIDLSRANIRLGKSGPFGAGVFNSETGELLAPGVNRVVPANNSVLHAEIVALMMAQRILGDWDLGADGQAPFELVSSTEPCAMCLGAVPWSGVRSLVCGARDEDARKIGLDEGVKPDQWVNEFRERGISVTRDVLREEASAVLSDYAQSGGIIYNGRRGGSDN